MNEEHENEVRSLRRLLQDLAELAEHASLTGALEGGARTAIRRYNAIVAHLEQIDAIPGGVFSEVAADAGYDELGVESKLLAGYLRDKAKPPESKKRPNMEMIVGLAPFMDRKELTELVRAHLPSEGEVNAELLIGLAPFLERGEIGKIIRQYLPEWFQQSAARSEEPEPAGEPGEEKPAGWQQAAARLEAAMPQALERISKPSALERTGAEAEIERHMATVGERIQAIAEQLGADDLSNARRADLSGQLARLGQEQARLARQMAAFREGDQS